MKFIAVTITIIQILSRLFPFQYLGDTNLCPEDEIVWRELTSSNFSIIYPDGWAHIGLSILPVANIDLEESFRTFVTFFETTIPVPVSIRIYPSEGVYACLNPLAPELWQATYATHLGAREIALIGEKIDLNQQGWQDHILNALRHELAILFVNKMTDGKIPPGLLAGIGAYAEDPVFVLGNRQTSGEVLGRPTLTWREMWESSDISQDRGTQIKALSSVAFLVDVYTWPKFRDFLNNLSRSEGYRQAISDTYRLEFSELEKQWHQYYPFFSEGRWRANVLYDFDLSVFEELIGSGAFSDAAIGLKESIVFLESIDETKKVEQAKKLLDTAKLGEEAGTLVSQSRQALEKKDYEKSITLAVQAEEIYNILDAHNRFEEIEIYRSRAEEILKLREELGQIKAQMGKTSSDPEIQRLKEIVIRLTELGDDNGSSIVSSIFEEIEAQREADIKRTIIIGFVVVMVLLIVRVLLMWMKPPQEAQLL